jgi:hypothetical protein
MLAINQNSPDPSNYLLVPDNKFLHHVQRNASRLPADSSHNAYAYYSLESS